MKIGLWALILPGLIWAVLRLPGWERGFLVQAFAFTPYVAAWTVVPAIVALATRRWTAAGLAVTAVAIMAWCVLPRALPDRDRGPADGNELTVMTINMFVGAADPAAIVKLVRDHDVAVLAVQEFSPTARMGLNNAGLDALLPHAALADEVGTTGSGLYSRYPITASHSERSGGGNMQVYATIQPPGTRTLDVVSAHPLAPYSTKVLKLWKGDLAAEPRVDILLGDFNSTLDHAPVRRLIARGYRDAADATGRGLIGTWGPYDGKPVPPVTLDHVLADKRIGVKDVRVHGVKGSDHRSVIATLVVAGGN
ncbi:endonuclease/exonuclease/phosphatase family protein [Actinoplanes sp. NPDC051343]|uniref:endonuclease/exonuclease/phosphatase family protein n=1 Tax=Actinoplanes sp. NPDC051343 TaxID=3363906 RepID=UPI0037A0B555